MTTRALESARPVGRPARAAGRGWGGRGVLTWPLAWALVAVVWIVSLPRMIPVLTLDRGIFVSVAERMLAGDRLYSGVWDNKDPFFYYSIALGRVVSPYADVVLEVLWVLLACTGTWSIARSLAASPCRALVVGFALAPVVLTGGVALPGYSHLPGIALSMLSIAALVRGRPLIAGLLLGLLAPFKLVLVPVVGAALLVLLLRRSAPAAPWSGRGTSGRDDRAASTSAPHVPAASIRGRRVPAVLQVAAGAVIAVGASAALVALRGELLPYLGSLVLNTAYAQTATLLDPGLPAPLAHLVRVERPVPDVATAAIVAGLVWSGWSAVRGRTASPLRCSLWLAALATAAASLALLAATGLWPQHDQVQLLPALLVLVLVAVRPAAVGRRAPVALQVLALVVVAVLLSGPAVLGPAWMQYQRTTVDALPALRSLRTTAPEAEALLARATASSYARVGQNHERGAAASLRAWRLACPRFHQYPFDPPAVLAANLRCLASARFVVVSWDARPLAGYPAWNAYLAGVDRLLASGYDCRGTRGIRVCERTSDG